MFFSIVPTRVHGFIDYLFGALLIASPWLFGFGNTNMAMVIPVVLGTAVITYSIFTCYELGAIHLIRMPAHLTIDLLVGIVLVVSPFLGGFYTRVFWPHLILGLVAIVLALITSRVSTPADPSQTNFPGTPHAA